ncbi:MAG: hypothetical protein LBG15_08210 [Dysgonamonadaceae bacterium]|jgi:hypothetical protein|nr:hypothetical protein [Dysgonamonadaceae bacterium]
MPLRLRRTVRKGDIRKKGVSIQTVYKALRYEQSSSVAIYIRAWALNNGGVEYVAQEPGKPSLHESAHQP